jgi:hypothetical protein
MSIAAGLTENKTLLAGHAAKSQLEARFNYVPARLSLLLSHHIGGRARGTEIVDRTLNFNCQQLDRLRDWLPHISVWLYSSERDLHLCVHV